VIVVQSDGYAATTATLETFQKVGGGWRPALGAMTARIGGAGFTDRKVEGDLATPTGVYGIWSTMYGIAADPGVRYRYHRLVEGDYWNGDPHSPGYNGFVHGADPGGGSEALWRASPQYRYLAVITYNVPARAADPPRGSAIFLHVVHPGHATAGCVSLAEADLVRVLRWLNPGAAPRIVMAPRQVIDRY
jgi:L,D-peptidoglycan transpeptidase YkuD (ErfK/YbiS/YcfS/YnhG family)